MQTQTRPGNVGNKRDHPTLLAKVEGQVRGTVRMVDDDRCCIDDLTQVAAATRALEQSALGLLDTHVRHCLTAAFRSSYDGAEVKLTEVNRPVAQALRLKLEFRKTLS